MKKENDMTHLDYIKSNKPIENVYNGMTTQQKRTVSYLVKQVIKNGKDIIKIKKR